MAKHVSKRFQSGHEVFQEFIPGYQEPTYLQESERSLATTSNGSKFVDGLLKELGAALKQIKPRRANNKAMNRSARKAAF
jgi:hypothetical protein